MHETPQRLVPRTRSARSRRGGEYARTAAVLDRAAEEEVRCAEATGGYRPVSARSVWRSQRATADGRRARRRADCEPMLDRNWQQPARAAARVSSDEPAGSEQHHSGGHPSEQGEREVARFTEQGVQGETSPALPCGASLTPSTPSTGLWGVRSPLVAAYPVTPRLGGGHDRGSTRLRPVTG